MVTEIDSLSPVLGVAACANFANRVLSGRVFHRDRGNAFPYNERMRFLAILGAILLLLGLASLFVPIPTRERHSIGAGDLSIGVETTTRQKVHPAISGVLIAGGVALLVVGGRGRRRG